MIPLGSGLTCHRSRLLGLHEPLDPVVPETNSASNDDDASNRVLGSPLSLTFLICRLMILRLNWFWLIGISRLITDAGCH